MFKPRFVTAFLSVVSLPSFLPYASLTEVNDNLGVEA